MPRQQNPPKYEPPRYMCPSSGIRLQQQQQQQQQPSQLLSKPTNTPLLRTYMKPLPKLPPDIEETREMSSTDDLSSRPHSPSVSSSDESYSKTTEGEGDEDSPRIGGNHLGKANNPLQWLYPCDIQVDPTSPKLSPVVDITDLKDFEVSSTTESQGQTATTQNKGDSCNSFEYHDRLGGGSSSSNAIGGVAISGGIGGGSSGNNGALSTAKSPFEREIQRILSESSRIRDNTNHMNSSSGSSGNHLNNSRNNVDLGMNNNNKSKYELESIDKGTRMGISTSFMLAKHPVGLEAIKEITRNKNPSESSQM